MEMEEQAVVEMEMEVELEERWKKGRSRNIEM